MSVTSKRKNSFAKKKSEKENWAHLKIADRSRQILERRYPKLTTTKSYVIK